MSAGMEVGLPGRLRGLEEGKNRKEEGTLKVVKTNIGEVRLYLAGGKIKAGEEISKMAILA